MSWSVPDALLEKEFLFFVNKILRENDLLLFKDCKESVLLKNNGDFLELEVLFLNESLLVLNCIFELDDGFLDIKSFNFKKITEVKDIVLFLEKTNKYALLEKVCSKKNNEDFKW